MIMLCMQTQAFITSHICSLDQVRARYLTVANQNCSTPNALSASFLQLQLSCHVAKWNLVGPRGVRIPPRQRHRLLPPWTGESTSRRCYPFMSPTKRKQIQQLSTASTNGWTNCVRGGWGESMYLPQRRRTMSACDPWDRAGLPGELPRRRQRERRRWWFSRVGEAGSARNGARLGRGEWVRSMTEMAQVCVSYVAKATARVWRPRNNLGVAKMDTRPFIKPRRTEKVIEKRGWTGVLLHHAV
jgi:hypothetical protein